MVRVALVSARDPFNLNECTVYVNGKSVGQHVSSYDGNEILDVVTAAISATTTEEICTVHLSQVELLNYLGEDSRAELLGSLSEPLEIPGAVKQVLIFIPGEVMDNIL